VDVWAVGVMCAEWLLEEQMGRRDAKALLMEPGGDGINSALSHRRLHEAVSTSSTPQSLLERVVRDSLV
jgi:hypothetical protein